MTLVEVVYPPLPPQNECIEDGQPPYYYVATSLASSSLSSSSFPKVESTVGSTSSFPSLSSETRYTDNKNDRAQVSYSVPRRRPRKPSRLLRLMLILCGDHPA